MRYSFILIFLFYSCGPIISVHHLSPDNKARMITLQNEKGIIYSLPKHAYDVSIVYTIEKTESPKKHNITEDTLSKLLIYPFPYYRDTHDVKILSVQITPVIIPDLDASYFAMLNTRRPLEDVKLDITLNGYNQISASGSESTSHLTPVLMTLAGVAGSILSPGAGDYGTGTLLTEANKAIPDLNALASKDKPTGITPSTYLVAHKDYYKKVTIDISKIDPVVKNSVDNLNLLNNEYQRLIISPNLNELPVRLSILKDRIKYHEEYLGGKKTIEQKDTVFRLEPTKKNHVLNEKIKIGGIEYTMILDFNNGGVSVLNPFYDLQKSPDNSNTIEPKKGSGICYRVPLQTNLKVTLLKDSKIVKSQSVDLVVPQFGIIRSLPPSKGYTRNFSYTLDPVTGALKSYSTNKKGISNEDAKSFASTIGDLENMGNKKLERHNKELELRIKQLELNQKIDSLKRD